VDQVVHARGPRSAHQDRRALLGAEVRQFIFFVVSSTGGCNTI
jgi:hypothetical protein